MLWKKSDVLDLISITFIFLMIVTGILTNDYFVSLAGLAAFATRYFSKLSSIVRVASQLIFLAAASTGGLVPALLSSIVAIVLVYGYSKTGDKQVATKLVVIAFATAPFYAISRYSLIYGLALFSSLLFRFVYSYVVLSKATAILPQKTSEAIQGEEIFIEVSAKSPIPLYWTIMLNEKKVVADKYLKEGVISFPITEAFIGLNTLGVKVYSEDPQGFGRRVTLNDTVTIRVRPRHTIALEKARRVLTKYSEILEPAEVYRAKIVTPSTVNMYTLEIEKAPPLPAAGIAGAGGKGAGTSRTKGERLEKIAPDYSETMATRSSLQPKILNLESEGAGSSGVGESGGGVRGAEAGGRGIPSLRSQETGEEMAKKTSPDRSMLLWVPYSRFYGAVSEAIRTLSSYGEYSGVREYQPGDRLKLIHWKKSLSLGRLVVKEYTTTPQKGGGTGGIQLVVADWTATNSADLDNLIYFTLLAILRSPPTSRYLVIILTPAGDMYLLKGKTIDVLDALNKLIMTEVSSLSINYKVPREISDYKYYIQTTGDKARLLVEYYEKVARWIYQTIREQGNGGVDSIMIVHASPTSLKYAVVSDYLRRSGYYTTVINASKIY